MKAQLKKKEEKVVEENNLTVEKRIELFIASYQKFEKESAETFGVKLGVELAYTPQAVVPRLVVMDLLKKNENKTEPKA